MLTRSLPLVVVGGFLLTQPPPGGDPLAELRRAMPAAVSSLDIPDQVKVMLVDRLDLVVPAKGDLRRRRALNRQLAAALPPHLRDLWLERVLDLATRSNHGLSRGAANTCSVVYNLAGDVHLRASALAYLTAQSHKHHMKDARDYFSTLREATGARFRGVSHWQPRWPATTETTP